MSTWSATWPTEPGAYWFHGRLYPSQEQPDLYLVKAVRPAPTKYNIEPDLVFSTPGVVLTREEAVGIWQRVSLPSVPRS